MTVHHREKYRNMIQRYKIVLDILALDVLRDLVNS